MATHGSSWAHDIKVVYKYLGRPFPRTTKGEKNPDWTHTRAHLHEIYNDEDDPKQRDKLVNDLVPKADAILEKASKGLGQDELVLAERRDLKKMKATLEQMIEDCDGVLDDPELEAALRGEL